MTVHPGGAMRALVPQMRDYEALAVKQIWQPYVMYFHAPRFVSPTVNTDDLGFRLTMDANGRPIPLRGGAERAVNLLVGNSVAFGIGSSRDDTCLASRLVAHTGEPWLNFCGRAFCSFQEWLLFHFHQPLVGTVRRVVIVSGLNDFILFFSPQKEAYSIYGGFFLSNHYASRMNRPPLGVRQALLRRLLFPLFGDRIDWSSDRPFARQRDARTSEGIQSVIQARIDHRHGIMERIRQALGLWADAARLHGFEITYALQPMQPWVDKAMSVEEKDLLAEQDAEGSHWNDLVRFALRPELHAWYAAEIEQVCGGLGIRFLDMHEAMRSPSAEWFFTDRVHLTDLGQDRLAAALGSQICA